MVGGVCSGTVVGGVAVVSVGGVAGSDQSTSSAMTTVAAMMSNVFLSIRIPLVLLPSSLLHSFSTFEGFCRCGRPREGDKLVGLGGSTSCQGELEQCASHTGYP
jgi:hypothetical protein